MDRLTKEQRHKNMKNIKSKDTSIELKLRKELWHRGYHYRKNYDLNFTRVSEEECKAVFERRKEYGISAV